jgi:hypothetical protein
VTTSFVSIAEVRALVRSSLSDVDLQAIIDREESWLASRIGVLTGSRTDTFAPGLGDTPLYLTRRTEAVVVTDNGTLVAASDLLFTPSTGCLRRAVWASWPPDPPRYPVWYPAWQGAVTVTYTPTDGADVTRAVIELVRLALDQSPGMQSETMGTYSYTRATGPGAISRFGLVRSILIRRPAYSMRLSTPWDAAL